MDDMRRMDIGPITVFSRRRPCRRLMATWCEFLDGPSRPDVPVSSSR